MGFKYQKNLIWVLVICFAWLQLLSPLLHAHSNKSGSQSRIGVHFHVDMPTALDAVPTLKNINAHGDVVNVDDTLVRDKKIPLGLLTFIVLFMLPVLLAQDLRVFPPVSQLLPLNLRRSPLAPRAPPYF